MSRELYDNTDFNAEDDALVAIKKFIQWFRGDGRGGESAGSTFTPAGSFPIPAFDEQVFAYYGATNNIQTITYKKDGATVSTLTFQYVGGGAADDDNVTNISQS